MKTHLLSILIGIMSQALFVYLERTIIIQYNCKFNYIKFTYSKSISGTFSSNNSLKNSSTASFELI